MDVCTIVAKNYLAHARVLARSFAEHHPDGRLHALVIDDFEGYISPEDEPFTLVTPSELGIEHFQRMAVLYDVVELSTAVKPWLMRWLLARSPDGMAVYLDPDMRLYARLDEMFEAVHTHGLVLCPHNVDPMPRDGRRPNEQDILIAGAYNLGFIGIGSGDFADQLLEWWSERLETDCIVDPARGFFVDQRWIDLIPGMASSFHLLRDRGFNVAYWNLASRPVSRHENGAWHAADVPLRLFHFSGFDQTRPEQLSKHQDRIILSEHHDLAELCGEYANELIEAGSEHVRDWPYTYARTASGIELNAVMRKLFRAFVTEGGAVEPAVDEDTEASFIAHLNGPAAHEAGGEAGITRYLAALYEGREDLRRAYPDLAGGGAAGYLGWAQTFGRGEVPRDLCPKVADLAPRPTGPAPRAQPQTAQQFGVNVAGYLNSELGVGEVARQAIRALDTAGVPLLPVGVPSPRGHQGHEFTHRGNSPTGFPVNLICVNADMLPSLATTVGQPFFAGRHSIGWWWWELSEFPERWMGSFAHIDELWAGSRFVREALAAVSPVPVLHMPTPVSVAGAPHDQPQRFGLPAGFSFLFTYDYASVLARKNPLGCIDAFLRAFPQPGEAVLVLKSINAKFHSADHDRVQAAARGHEHIKLLDDYLAPADKDNLLASCDCYLSLHRSEGFGMAMAEAMYLGKPVIATAYSGNLDFMTPENSYLVDYTLTPVGKGCDPYPPEALWADPDLDQAAALMRDVLEDSDETLLRARRAHADIRRTHSVAVAGAKMEQRLRKLDQSGLVGGGGWEAPAALARASRADATLTSGPRPAAGAGHGQAARHARDLVLKLMRPYTAHQQSVDRDMLDALMAIGRDVRDLGKRGVAVEAVALRGLREVELRMRSIVENDRTAADARTDSLVRQVDELRSQLHHHDQLLELFGVVGEPPETDGYPLAPEVPWSEEYNEAHAGFVARALDDERLIDAIRTGGALPGGYGRGFDERVIEFPWIAGRDLGGAVLDAGSTLNHLHVLRRLRQRMDDLHIVTLAPEDRAFPSLGVSYVFADLRRLPFRDDVYDRVLSLSTLEHVGLDLEHFKADGGAAGDPQQEALIAADELRRVLRPGGELLLTVPVGRPERFAWVRSLSPDELDALIARLDPVAADIAFFRHDGGWRSVDRSEVVDARYRDHLSGEPPRNGIVAAEAVACVALTMT